MRVKIPRPISGGLLLSYKCSAACRHCIYACSPTWPADWIPVQDLEDCLTQLRGRIKPSPWGKTSIDFNYGLHFTGGEPFLNFDLLLSGAKVAGELGIASTFVETNCFWCHDDESTREKLELLKEAGLRGIMISVNPFYAEYVPFEHTERCIKISKTVFGRNVLVYQLEFYQQFRRLGLKERLSFQDYLGLAEGTGLAGRVELLLSGRAPYELRDLYPAFPAERFLAEPCLPPFLRDWHNHFDNYGNVMPGYCGGISLGRWQDLARLESEGIDLEEHPILKFLWVGNMQGLFHFARDFGYQEPTAGYVSKCHLCLDLRKYLVGRKNFTELEPKEFYNHIN